MFPLTSTGKIFFVRQALHNLLEENPDRIMPKPSCYLCLKPEETVEKSGTWKEANWDNIRNNN